MTEGCGLRVHLVSLGCPKNLIDSEILLGGLLREGYSPVSSPEQADLILVNTCAFIQEAKEEAVETILELASFKHRGRCRHLVVVGCLPQRYGEELLELMPEVDLFLGSGEIPRVVAHLKALGSGGGRACHLTRADYLLDDQALGIRPAVGPTAYVRVAEGCSNRCAYCAVPLIRGPLRSRPMDSVIHEVKWLVEKGAQEVVLVAQDTSAFGLDRKGRSELPELIEALDQVEGLRWLRLMYVHPARVDERLVKVIAGASKLCPYLDLPVQHIAPRILDEMNRKVGPREIRERISMIRKAMPGVQLRTSIIVGFPGETEQEFRELLAFMEEVRFEWLGAFLYSREEGTPAALLPNQVPRKVARRRLRELMELQRSITRDALERWVGRDIPVLVESVGSRGMVGRAAFQAPDIDGIVRIRKGRALVGSFPMVRVTGVRGYDLEGVLLPLS